MEKKKEDVYKIVNLSFPDAGLYSALWGLAYYGGLSYLNCSTNNFHTISIESNSNRFFTAHILPVTLLLHMQISYLLIL